MRYIYILLFTLFGLISCQKDRNPAVIDGDVSTITFNATFNASNSSSSIASKATATAFENGDRVGVYVTKGDAALQGMFNALDNKLFAYFASGDSLSGVPTAALYPDKTTPVAAYAYYPYMPSVSNALAIGFKVSNDLKSSDLCYASLPKQSPSATALKLTFSHKLSKLMVNVDFNAISSKVESVKSIIVRGVKDSCYLNLSSGVVTTSNGSVVDIETTSTGVFILPAQTLSSSRAIDVVCKAKDGAADITLSYYSDSSNPITLTSGYSQTINLIASGGNSLQLSDRTTIEPWTESVTTSNLNQSANNHFTLHWLIPDSRYAQTKSIVINVRDSRSGVLSPYSATNILAASDNDNLKASFTFDVIDANLGYPYTIESISFVDNGGAIIQTCKSIIAAVVYRRGDLTIGLQQDNILTITTGTIKSWNGENLGGTISGGGVANAFVLTMYEPLTFTPSLDYRNVSSVNLTMDGALYTFSSSKITISPSSNNMIASVLFSLPDDNGKTPVLYPYTIEAIELKNSASASLYNGYCDIAVSSGATVNVNLYKGGKVELATEANISAWGSGTASGEVIYTGPLSTNLLSVVYCNGSATAANECTSLGKVELTTAAGVMTVSPYTMTGTRFAASSTVGLNIATSSGAKPTNYPFAITKVRLFKADGTTVLEDITPTAPIWIYQSGNVQFQVMK